MSAPFFGNTMIIWDSYKNGIEENNLQKTDGKNFGDGSYS